MKTLLLKVRLVGWGLKGLLCFVPLAKKGAITVVRDGAKIRITKWKKWRGESSHGLAEVGEYSLLEGSTVLDRSSSKEWCCQFELAWVRNWASGEILGDLGRSWEQGQGSKVSCLGFLSVQLFSEFSVDFTY